MPQTYFILDSTHADYAGVLSALGTTTAAKYGGSYSQVVHSLVAPYSTDYRLVKANIEDSERTGSLAPIAAANHGVGVFVEELGRDDVLYNRDARMDILQLSGRRREVIRPEDAGPFGADDGTTFKDGRSGLGDSGMGTEYQPGTTYDLCDGLHVKTRNGVGVGSLNDSLDFPAGDADRPIRFRHDHPVAPAMVDGGFIEVTGGDTWRPDGESNAYYKDNAIQGNYNSGGWFEKINDVTIPTTKIISDHWLIPVSGIEELRRTPGSQFAENPAHPATPYDGRSSTGGNARLWVHLKDGSDPTGKIVWRQFGYHPKYNGADTSPNKVGIEFINMNYINGPGVNVSGQVFPVAKFHGGRCLVETFKPLGVLPHGAEFGEGKTGRIQFSTKDRYSRIDVDVLTLVKYHGVTEDEMDPAQWLECGFASQGIYFIHSGGPYDNHNGVRIDGVYFSEIGSPLRGINRDDGDSHAIGQQGGSNWICRRFFVRKAGSAVNFYASDATANSNFQKNNLIEKFIIRDSHQRFIAGAGQNGVNLNGDGSATLRVNGTGDRSGNVIRQFVIGNIRGDPTNLSNPPAMIIDGTAILMNLDQLLDVSEGTLRDNQNDFLGGRNLTSTSDMVKFPDLIDVEMKRRNLRHVNTIGYAHWHRPAGWFDESPSPDNVGYWDIDDCEFIIPAGQDTATRALWRITNTEYVLTAWRAAEKGSPPGAVASVHDPNSTITNGPI